MPNAKAQMPNECQVNFDGLVKSQDFRICHFDCREKSNLSDGLLS
jgi:hypothetical protein